MEGKKNKKYTIFLAVISIISLIFVYMHNIESFFDKNKETSKTAIENAIKKSALKCYALEGSFPPSIKYLQENYGLIVNEDEYFYHYNVEASNILPDIKVIKRWNDEE